MQILQNLNSHLHPVLSNSKDTSLENYIFEFDHLKKEENWSQIIYLGHPALSSPSIELSQKAKIYAQLASCSFYLGDYEGCAKHANCCLEISESLDDITLLMRSLYLLSAHKRAEGNQQARDEPELAAKSFEEGRLLIDKALLCFDRCEDDFMKAKVLFNVGAVLSDDPQGDLELAIPRYQEAQEIYSNLNEVDDWARTSIRLGKVFLLQGKYDQLLEVLTKVDPLALPIKTKVHYQYLEAQYYVSVKEPKKAQCVLLQAIEDARSLEMEADLGRLTTLLKTIEV